MLETKPETKFNFKLGSDPEFSFVLQGRRVSACELLNANINKSSEFKSEEKGFSCEAGEFGWDGSDATAELRTKPSNSVTDITNNIKILLTKLHRKLPTFDLSVLSTFAPVGGHIHFEVNEDMHNSLQKMQLLHKKISSFFIPIMLSENKINLRIRTGAQSYNNKPYGTLVDFHTDNVYELPNGKKEYTYEFRTPSAEWLTTEKICRATFAYLGTIYNEILNRPQNFAQFLGLVYKNNEQAKSLHQLIITEYTGITESLFKQIKKAVKTFELYPEFKEEIDYIFNPKKVMSDKKKANYNIVQGWKLAKAARVKRIPLANILSDKKFRELASCNDLDKMVSLINITYNDDINVETFVRALAERASAFNWKLKNNYYIFGLKKGIGTQIVFNEKEEILFGKEIIKTESDRMALKELLKKISSKFIRNQDKHINMMTGEVESTRVTIIGLPYEIRLNKNIKEFLKLIYQLEEGNLKPQSVDTLFKDLPDDLELPEEERGALYKYVFNIKTEPSVGIEGVVYDEVSQGRNIAVRNTELVINEIQEDERSNAEPEVAAIEITSLVGERVAN